MLRDGLLNPHINSLISRVRHTNTLVIADRGFPYWPDVETVDVAVVDDVPRVLDVLRPILARCVVGRAFMAEEFRTHNDPTTREAFARVLGDVPVTYEPHDAFKRRVPRAVGLIRTADTVPYANLILESA